jgi:signal transduction histidine kinase
VARYVNYEGVEVIGTSVAIPKVPWLYLSEVSVASALGQLRGLALLAAAIESVFALLLVAIVWTVARSIVAPLRRLVVAAERIRKGDLGVDVEIKRGDELGDLGRTFNQMSSELQSSARKIRDLHEQEMRRAAQLASVGELASGIAHEIKNPLIGVASGVDLLARQIGTDPKSAAVLDQIYAQVDRIESAIQDLLSYASPKEPLYTWTDPKQLVERLLTLVRPQADAAEVQITERHVESLPTIRVDPELLTQALVNLALNAIQAMGPGGVLRISLESESNSVRFSVSDTGKGVTRDELDRIYRPFYTTKHQGTGLGLAITREIVDRHGGHIEIESKVGEGSTFTLVIPASPQEALVQ